MVPEISDAVKEENERLSMKGSHVLSRLPLVSVVTMQVFLAQDTKTGKRQPAILFLCY